MKSATPARREETTRPKVVVIDDSTVIRGGFGLVHSGLDVVAAYPSVEAYEAEPVASEVIVLDLLLRGPQSLETASTKQGRSAIRALRGLGLPVCLYTDERRTLVLALCLRAGANGVVHKSDPAAVVTRAIEDIRDDQVVVTQSLVGLAEMLDRRGHKLELSPRQRQVLSARARGRQWNDIADSLFISENTAREHHQAVCAKLRDYLQYASAGDMERAVGLAPNDVLADD